MTANPFSKSIKAGYDAAVRAQEPDTSARWDFFRENLALINQNLSRDKQLSLQVAKGSDSVSIHCNEYPVPYYYISLEKGDKEAKLYTANEGGISLYGRLIVTGTPIQIMHKLAEECGKNKWIALESSSAPNNKPGL